MHRLIDDILELSAIEAGNVRVNREPVSLRLVVEEVIGSLSTVVRSNNITIRNEVPPSAFVFADPHRLAQMLTNLIHNAVKFNRQDGSVTVRYEGNHNDRIFIEDTGEGIPAHHLDRLFERFYRVDRARSRELGGTGLGLAIVKHLAKAQGGEVSVRSKFGEGSVFMIELPRSALTSDTNEPAQESGQDEAR
jgi:two-component system phosphate regulon sensor histidine kinase PhoR